uniref:Uncharacterized protein n=1 Tax=Arundo donax TaxID=35708 RepID=A0A0A8XT08_ARUDO
MFYFCWWNYFYSALLIYANANLVAP